MVKAKTINQTNKVWRRLSVAFLLLAAIWFVSWIAAKFLIVDRPLQHADAIVMLSGASTFRERAKLAAQLYKSGTSSKIILTNDDQQAGWFTQEQRNLYYSELAVRQLQNEGVPFSAIVLIPQTVNSTFDEAVLIRDYAKSHELRSVLIVTSGYHSRRAFRTFRRTLDNSMEVGIQPVPPGYQTPVPATWWLHVRGWQMVPWEYGKLIYYAIAK